jgi:hypothetical protein
MAAFNTQTMLARTITTATGYRKAGNEAHRASPETVETSD